jgi:formylmethanofuran dehydrogenase subunit D
MEDEIFGEKVKDALNSTMEHPDMLNKEAMQSLEKKESWKMKLRKGIKELELDNGDKIEVRKSGGSYKVVKPIVNKDGSWNWFNLLTGGSWANIIILAIIIGVIILCFTHYAEAIRVANECLMNESGRIIALQ